MNIDEIDDIVFKGKSNKNSRRSSQVASAYGNRKNSKPDKLKAGVYEEEESYENPINLSKAPDLMDEYVDIRSEQNLTAEQSTFIKQIDHEEDKFID